MDAPLCVQSFRFVPVQLYSLGEVEAAYYAPLKKGVAAVPGPSFLRPPINKGSIAGDRVPGPVGLAAITERHSIVRTHGHINLHIHRNR